MFFFDVCNNVNGAESSLNYENHIKCLVSGILYLKHTKYMINVKIYTGYIHKNMNTSCGTKARLSGAIILLKIFSYKGA